MRLSYAEQLCEHRQKVQKVGFDVVSVKKFSLDNCLDLNPLTAAIFSLYGGQTLTDE